MVDIFIIMIYVKKHLIKIIQIELIISEVIILLK